MNVSTNVPRVALRTIDVGQPVQPLTDVCDYARVRILVLWHSRALGMIEVDNYYQAVGELRLRQEIAHRLSLQILARSSDLSPDLVCKTTAMSLINSHTPIAPIGANASASTSSSGDAACAGVVAAPLRRSIPNRRNPTNAQAPLPPNVSVSIVVTTYDRPNDLYNCLLSLVAQRSPRRVEIIVVDNHPSSGFTPPVVALFPTVLCVPERREGIAYARNAGFAASTGDIVVTTDDDVIAPPEWLEKVLAPFARSDVMVVTGNILPAELETAAQHCFEIYGGLGRGFERVEADQAWFKSFRLRAVPAWGLGAGANAAFRATMFAHAQIGMMEEALGAGMPSGCGEETYQFYKVLKAGYTIVYEPDAYVWHRHRRTMPALYRQLYNYSKGATAYHLTTLLRDRDPRAVLWFLLEVPRTYLWRLKALKGGHYSVLLLFIEMIGHLVGFSALLISYWRVRREGRSRQYLPLSQRM